MFAVQWETPGQEPIALARVDFKTDTLYLSKERIHDERLVSVWDDLVSGNENARYLIEGNQRALSNRMIRLIQAHQLGKQPSHWTETIKIKIGEYQTQMSLVVLRVIGKSVMEQQREETQVFNPIVIVQEALCCAPDEKRAILNSIFLEEDRDCIVPNPLSQRAFEFAKLMGMIAKFCPDSLSQLQEKSIDLETREGRAFLQEHYQAAIMNFFMMCKAVLANKADPLFREDPYLAIVTSLKPDWSLFSAEDRESCVKQMEAVIFAPEGGLSPGYERPQPPQTLLDQISFFHGRLSDVQEYSPVSWYRFFLLDQLRILSVVEELSNAHAISDLHAQLQVYSKYQALYRFLERSADPILAELQKMCHLDQLAQEVDSSEFELAAIHQRPGK